MKLQECPLFVIQEISPHSKSYVVGPASLSAVKTGQSMDYDTDFVVAEVNADIRDYCEVEKDKFVLAVTDTKRVSSLQSTPNRYYLHYKQGDKTLSVLLSH